MLMVIRFSRRRVFDPALEFRVCLSVFGVSAFLFGCAGGGGGGPGNVNVNVNVNDNREPGPVTAKFDLWSTGVHLRGANLYQRRVYPELDGEDFLGPGPIGPPYSQADFDDLAALGANYVNLSHPGLYSEAPPYRLDADVQANLDALIDMAEAADLFVVISFRTGPGRSEFAIFEGHDWFPQDLINNEVWTDQAAQDAWADMWRSTAQRYAGRSVVVGYDLMVEPNGSSTIFGTFDPEEFYADHRGSLADWNQLYPRISAAIREIDADTPILISAMSYGSLNWLPYLEPTGDERTVYTVHHYEPFSYTHQDPAADVAYPGQIETDAGPEEVNRAWLDALLAPVDAFKADRGAPVAINEFGVTRWSAGAAAYFADQADLFESRGINHAVWLWESSHPPLAEFDDFNFRHGADSDNHQDLESALQDAVRASWSRNTDRPSTFDP